MEAQSEMFLKNVLQGFLTTNILQPPLIKHECPTSEEMRSYRVISHVMKPFHSESKQLQSLSLEQGFETFTSMPGCPKFETQKGKLKDTQN